MRPIIICVIALAMTAAPQRTRRARAPKPDPAPAAARVVRNRCRSSPARSRCCRWDRCGRRAGSSGSWRFRRAGSPGGSTSSGPTWAPTAGGSEGSGESWERGPYYLDGLVPLAYLLEDPALIAKAQRYVEWTLTNQADTRVAGPEEQHRLVAEHGDAQGADAVPGGHRRPTRRAGAHPLLRASRRRLPPAGRCTTGPSIAGPTNWPPSSGSSTGRPTRGCWTWRAR